MAIKSPISPVVATVNAPQTSGNSYILDTVQSNLKNFYLPTYDSIIEDQTHPLYNKMEALEGYTVSGNSVIGLLDLGLSTGAATAGNGYHVATTTDARHASVNYIINPKNLVLNATIDMKASLASKSPAGAFYDETAKQLDKMREAHMNHLAFGVHAGAFGAIDVPMADVAGVTAKTLVVKVANGNRFKQGMGIAFAKKADGTAVDAQYQKLVVVKKAFTRADAGNAYEANLTIAKEDGTAFTSVAVPAASSIIVYKFEGTEVSEITGVVAQLSQTTGDLFNLDRTNYYFQGQEIDATGSLLDDQELRAAKDLAKDANGSIDFMYAQRNVIATYEATLGKDRRFVPANRYIGGYEVLSHDGQEFWQDTNAELGKVVGLDSEKWKRVEMTSGVQWKDWHGSMFVPTTGFAYEVSGFEVKEIFCQQPSANFVIKGIEA